MQNSHYLLLSLLSLLAVGGTYFMTQQPISNLPENYRPASKTEFNNCVAHQQCMALDCVPGSKYVDQCLEAKEKYKTCAWNNDLCEQYSDIFDNLGWGEDVPAAIRQCWEPQNCGASQDLSYDYYEYQQCFYKCTMVKVPF